MILKLSWVVFLLGGGWWSHCDGCWDHEKTALMHLQPYFSYNVDGVSEWGEGEGDCCKWEGVHCNDSSGRVIGLYLGSFLGQPIHGFFDDSIANDALNEITEREQWYLHISLFLPFQELTTLDLIGNGIAGFVHNQEKGEPMLIKLEALYLSYNLFNNSILSFLGILPNLRSLTIDNNKLEGNIHIKELNSLSNLEELIMSRNQVTDFVLSQDDETQLRLMNLNSLELEDNPFNSSILASLGRLRNLRYLGLGGSNFTGSIDLTELNALTHLEFLSLYCASSFTDTDSHCSLPLQSLALFPSLNTVHLEGFNIEGTVMDSQKLTALTRLEHLLLSCYYDDSSLTATDNNCSLPLQSLLLFPSLKTVYLEGFNIEGTIMTSQNKRHNFTKLEELDVYGSFLQTNILGSIGQFISLKRLELFECEMNGNLNILEGLCKLTNLQELVLYSSNLKGNLSECFSNLTSLHRLDLSSNQFSGNIDSFKSLASLRELSVSYNRFEIPISLAPLSNLSKLESINADNNLIYAETLIHSSAPRFQLKRITLSCCGDVGSFPEFFYHQQDLQYLDLSNIFFKGNQFPNWLLDNNSNLEFLYLTTSSLSGPLQLPLSSHIHLSVLEVSDNFFNGSIPTEIGEKLPSLRSLNMSKNHFIGSIPSSFGHMTSLTVLDLSNNKLEGKIFSGNSKLPNLRVLKLNGNTLSGMIPDLLSKSLSLLALDVSNNTLSGSIPRWMGNMSSLQRIIISNNHLQGSIPIEFCQLDFLVLVDLSVNNISGSIPSCFNPSQIIQVHLAKNRLRGTLPDALRNSSTLVTLDIRENFLNGSIPSWIGGLSNLSYLLLSKNNFQGDIPMELCSLNHLSMIDLSHNNLSGQIPPCLNLTTLGDVDYVNANMSGPGEFSLNEPIEFPMKNVYNSYRGRNIPLVSGIDLSCNKLVSEIPAQIGDFHKILVLNLSHNSLTGPIPPTFSNLKKIESLDLSYNKLSGNIPSQLVGLTFMSFFNVSFNNLSGRTPSRVAQFGTFDEFSYMGNPFLCGEPLPKCVDTGSSLPKPNSSTDNDEDYGLIDMGAFRVTFIASYTVMLLAVAVVLYINPYWRRAWFYHAETAATFCYYFVLDNLLPRWFHC